MKPQTRRTDSFHDLFRHWQNEHVELDQCLVEIRNWTYEVAQLGVPRFGEAAEKLTHFRDRLLTHFRRETDLGSELAARRSVRSPEVEQACRQAEHDHHNLATRLNDLIDRLSQVNPPFASWQEAEVELDLFVDALEQHEEMESENMQWLSPDPQDLHD